jgi:hypothetical protein
MIFIPKRIKVGFQERNSKWNSTYTGKLAYIIYYDNKGKLRKETSWKGWKDDKIPDVEFDNIPFDGFVLNKKAGGYNSGWNHRQTYCRVYDPRDFEFEITIPNLLYVLENTNSIKGKGLEGQFVYGWDGKDLLLVPVDSPDYIDLQKQTDNLYQNKYNQDNLIIGATYLTCLNKKQMYVGRYRKYDLEGKSKGLFYYFIDLDDCNEEDWNHSDYYICFLKNTDTIIDIVNEDINELYPEAMMYLENRYEFIKIDTSKDSFERVYEDSYSHYDKKYLKKEGKFYSNYRIQKDWAWGNSMYKLLLDGRQISTGSLSNILKNNELYKRNKKRTLINGREYNE